LFCVEKLAFHVNGHFEQVNNLRAIYGSKANLPASHKPTIFAIPLDFFVDSFYNAKLYRLPVGISGSWVFASFFQVKVLTKGFKGFI